MAEQNNIRYHVDFDLVPSIYHKNPGEFALSFSANAEEMLANIYTYIYSHIKPDHFWQRRPKFSKTDFQVLRKKYPDGLSITYVLLPPLTDQSLVYCTAYAVTIWKNEAHFYTIEQSVTGTSCIGSVAKDGTHINYGSKALSVEENLAFIHSLELRIMERITPDIYREYKPDGTYIEYRGIDSVITQHKEVKPDGSYVEYRRDPQSEYAQISQYAPNGNLIKQCYTKA